MGQGVLSGWGMLTLPSATKPKLPIKSEWKLSLRKKKSKTNYYRMHGANYVFYWANTQEMNINYLQVYTPCPDLSSSVDMSPLHHISFFSWVCQPVTPPSQAFPALFMRQRINSAWHRGLLCVQKEKEAQQPLAIETSPLQVILKLLSYHISPLPCDL